MKPRARRVTIAAAALGAAVVGALVVAHWSAVRDHVEAWHFQLNRETETIEPSLEAPTSLTQGRDLPIESERTGPLASGRWGE